MDTHFDDNVEIRTRFNKQNAKFSREMDRFCLHGEAYQRAEGTVRPLLRGERNYRQAADTFRMPVDGEKKRGSRTAR